MYPYIICFSVSILSTYLASNLRYTVSRSHANIINIMFAAIAIFCPCYLAAVRDSTIGYDVALYGDSLLESATRVSDLASYLRLYNTEKLYLVLTYIVANYGNRYIYYFILQFLVVAPFYMALQRGESKKHAWLGMLLYYCWIFPLSLNILRQAIAISIVIWGYRYMHERKLIKYTIVVIVAMGFHITAILGLSIYFIHVLTVSKPFGETSWIRKKLANYGKLAKFLIVLLILVGFIFSTSIISLITSSTGRFIFATSSNEGGWEWKNLLIMGSLVLILLPIASRTREKEIHFLFFLICIGTIVYQLKFVEAQLYRISLYYTGHMILAIPIFIECSKVKERKLIGILVTVISVFNFWIYIVIYLWHSVYPYTSQYLGIG